MNAVPLWIEVAVAGLLLTSGMLSLAAARAGLDPGVLLTVSDLSL